MLNFLIEPSERVPPQQRSQARLVSGMLLVLLLLLPLFITYVPLSEGRVVLTLVAWVMLAAIYGVSRFHISEKIGGAFVFLIMGLVVGDAWIAVDYSSYTQLPSPVWFALPLCLSVILAPLWMTLITAFVALGCFALSPFCLPSLPIPLLLEILSFITFLCVMVVAGALLRTQHQKRIEQQFQELEAAYQQLKSANEEMKLIQMQLIQTAKLASLGEMATGIAHELSQPLMVIQGYTQLSMEAMEDPTAEDSQATIREMCETVSAQTKRMGTIIRHLKAFGRQSMEKNLFPTDLNTVIRNSLLLLKEQLKTQNIEVIQQLSSSLPAVYCDPFQMEQVLINLLINAKDELESLPGHGKIIVRSFQEGTWAILEVEDNGRGIPREIQSRIFDPFFTTKEVGKGTGLGLSISYGILQAHHGQLKVSSEPERGAVFRLELPLVSGQ